LAEARKLRSAGKVQDALAKVNQSLAKRRSVSALLLKANLLLKLRDADGALAAATAAVKAAPSSASAWRIKGVIHLELGQNGPAKQAFGKYLQLKPKARDREDIQLLIDSL
jgi:Flp pilus assembly protein TadD